MTLSSHEGIKEPSKNDNVRTETLNMRIKPADRSLFGWASKVQGKSLSDFILEAARRAAEEALLDRALVQVNADSHDEFLARLVAHPKANDRLRKTMRTKAIWE